MVTPFIVNKIHLQKICKLFPIYIPNRKNKIMGKATKSKSFAFGIFHETILLKNKVAFNLQKDSLHDIQDIWSVWFELEVYLKQFSC